MFNNLIESSSHTTELKRRGSFFLFTVATYAVLFVAAGVASIYAYDAQMEDPNAESVVMLSPVDFPQPEPEGPRSVATQSGGSNTSTYVRRNPQATVDNPQVVPTTTSSAPNTNPVLPPGALIEVGPIDSDPGPGGPGKSGANGGGGNTAGGAPVVVIDTPPPPVRLEKTKPQMVHKRVLNGEALLLPKPPYPPLARQMRVQGTVLVQVLIDETGRVVSAKAVSGNPALVTAAQRAALEARFSPTKLNDQAVKVSGVITYNFVLQ